MNRQKIYKRTAFKEIVKFINTDDVLLLFGARQVGKTHLLYYLQNYLNNKQKTVFYFDLEDFRYLELFNSGIDHVIQHLREQGVDLKKFNQHKKLYLLVDEIQYLKHPTNFLKLAADHHKQIKLIVSGSSTLKIKQKFYNSLVGRIIKFNIYPLSFAEFLTFKQIGIKPNKLQKPLTSPTLKVLISSFREYCLYGGYPKIVLEDNLAIKEKYLAQIINTYIKKDIKDFAEIKNLDKFNKLVEVLASQSGKLLNISELSNTCNLTRQTVEHYLTILEETFIIKLLKPFSQNIRSELFKQPKIFFLDTGLMQMLWLKQLQKQILGNVFETAIYTELIKNFEENNLFYWRTTNQQEIDFILRKKNISSTKNKQLSKNRMLPIEVKLNFQANINQSSLDYFLKKYNLSEYKIVCLEGAKDKTQHSYPWEIALLNSSVK